MCKFYPGTPCSFWCRRLELGYRLTLMPSMRKCDPYKSYFLHYFPLGSTCKILITICKHIQSCLHHYKLPSSCTRNSTKYKFLTFCSNSCTPPLFYNPNILPSEVGISSLTQQKSTNPSSFYTNPDCSLAPHMFLNGISLPHIYKAHPYPNCIHFRHHIQNTFSFPHIYFYQ